MNIKNELEKRTHIFNNELKKYLVEKNPEMLYKSANHLLYGGGKRLRPSLAILCCESVSGDTAQVMPFAVALELVHNFTLVHDDIMDNSHMRRNIPTVHVKFGEPTAILAGDFLFAKSFEAMHSLSIDLPIFKELEYGLIKCVEDICKGQQLDMEFEKRTIVTEDEYLRMIQKKTAVLFRFAARGGAIIGKGSKDEINALTDYGRFLGLAFQIWDDYLDISSNESVLGKDMGNDIRNGKKTLIAVHSIENLDNKNKDILKNIFGNKNATDADIKKIFQLFKESKSIEYAKNVALDYSNKAKKSLKILKDSHAKRILEELADYSIRREK